jgi:hypothetical protein
LHSLIQRWNDSADSIIARADMALYQAKIQDAIESAVIVKIVEVNKQQNVHLEVINAGKGILKEEPLKRIKELLDVLLADKNTKLLI